MSKIREVLDCAIRDAEGNRKGGYVGKRGKVYPNYMHNEEWADYLHSIPEAIQKAITKELAGNPPHMACFGSSCRMAYNRLKKVKNIVFEYGLPTEVGGEAQLDAYIQAKKIEIFIEAKCHEIYGSHRIVEVSEVYLPVFDKLQEFFTYAAEKSKKGYVKCSFKVMEQEILHFDLKQLICHFLGISAGLLKGAIKSKKIRFVYLIFNPHHIKDRICDKYRKKILDQYDKAIEEINLFDMEKLFEAIFEYQRSQNKNISHNYEGDIPEFEFFVADQDNGARYFE